MRSRPVPAIKAAIASIDPDVPVHRVTTMRRVVDDSLATDRFAAFLLAAFALIAVLLAGVGVFGVFSSDAAARRREIGIRLALGSSTGGILGPVLRRAALYATVGIVIGSVIAVSVAGGCSSLLFGVFARGPGHAHGRGARRDAAGWVGDWRCQPGGQLRRSPLDTLRES